MYSAHVLMTQESGIRIRALSLLFFPFGNEVQGGGKEVLVLEGQFSEQSYPMNELEIQGQANNSCVLQGRG